MKGPKVLARRIVLVNALIVLAMFLWVWLATPVQAQGSEEIRFIDTHNHSPFTGPCAYDENRLQEVVLKAMNDFNIQKTLFMPPPHSPENVPDCLNKYDNLIEMVARHPDRFAFLRGGENLNPLIQRVVHGEVTLQDAIPEFVNASRETLRAGAVGFGEMAAEHFSFHTGHPYISAPPDHHLFLLLADIAAGHDVPIDLHMEAISADIDRTQPDSEICTIAEEICRETDNPNPETFKENITAFKRLLRHNRHARIIWAHAGWDNTGHRTVDLMRQLLEDHPNLYIQLRPLAGQPNGILKIVSGQLKIREEWLELISNFADRFIIGLDSFYAPFKQGQSEEEFEGILFDLLFRGRKFVNELQKFSSDLVRKVAYENAVRIYRLDQPIICHRPGTSAEQTLRVNARDLAFHQRHGDTLGPCS